MYGVDFSQHGGALTDNTVQCWKNNDIEFAIIQYSERMRQHLDALERVGGLHIEAYVYLYWEQDPWQQSPQTRTRNALAMAASTKFSGYRIKRLWLDAEDSSHPFREDQLLDCVEICREAGMPTGIYTGRWWWIPNTGNSQMFKHLPLWHAEYTAPDGSGEPHPELAPNFNRFNPYGGWIQPTIWQFQNTHPFCGHSVDLNIWPNNVPVPPPSQEEEDEMLRHNAIHKDNGFREREVDENGLHLWDVRGDFDLPGDARRVRIEIFLKEGQVRVHDGDAGLYAGRAGWDGVNYSFVDVDISDGGMTFYGPATFAILGCVGYWR